MTLFKKTPQQSTTYYELLEEIERVKTQMDNAYLNFQSARDPDLIDCYIFESNANSGRNESHKLHYVPNSIITLFFLKPARFPSYLDLDFQLPSPEAYLKPCLSLFPAAFHQQSNRYQIPPNP